MKWGFLYFFLSMTFFVDGQKIMQIEMRGSPKSYKFYIGDEISFRLKGEKIWYDRRISDLDLEAEAIIIPDLEGVIAIPISDITHIKNPNKGKWVRYAATFLMVSGANTVFSTLILQLRDIVPSYGEEPAPLIFGAGSFLLGFGLRKWLGKNRVKLNERNHIRLLDLTLYPPQLPVKSYP